MHCKHLISQLATYSWDPAASKRGEDKSLLICAEVAKRYGRIGSWSIHFRRKPQIGAKEGA
jgi:hypothetical protein